MTPDEIATRIHQTPDGLARYLTVLLAGKIAEDLVAVDEQEGLSALEDRMLAEAYAARHLGLDRAKAELPKIEERCTGWFREPAIRAAVDAVAAALLEHGTLSGPSDRHHRSSGGCGGEDRNIHVTAVLARRPDPVDPDTGLGVLERHAPGFYFTEKLE